jgi:D-3-phosphoglycerate dehydrogenase
MYHILVADDILPEGLAVLRAAPDAHTDDLRLSRADLLARIGGYDALIIRSGTPVDRALIERGARLKVIGRAGISLSNVDIAAATERGVMVLHTPQANSLATAEHTFALLLAVCRHIPQAEASLRRGEWERSRFLGAQLHGKTLGVIGFGRVGQLVAARALAFGMNVLAYDPYLDLELARQLRVTVTSFNDLLARADILSLHAVLTPETRRLIGAPELARAKRGALFINTAHGELVDEAALHAALVSGQLAGAALDVYAHEPPFDSPLLQLPNVICIPHLGASTVEAQRDVSIQIAQHVLEALRGENYHNVVNLPFVPGPNFQKTRPYLELAEKIGALHAQLAGGRITRLEVEVKGEGMNDLVKPAAVALLKGLLGETANYINAPTLAVERGLTVTQARGLPVADYANLISCRVTWAEGERLIAGTLFGGTESRIVQLDDFRMDAKPEGTVLVMFSRDVPGVIGKVGTLLYQFGINIAEWRLGRDAPGGTALSFINLDAPMSAEGLAALRALPEVTEARTVRL